MPPPRSVWLAIVASRSYAVSVSGRSSGIEEVRVRALAPAADPAAQLVQLGEPEQVGPLADQRVGVADVEAVLDDRRADQDVEPLLPEVDDHLLEHVLVHLPVRDRDPRLRHELADLGRGPVDRLHPVVDVEHLAVAQQLAPERGGDLLLVVRADEREHRVALLRRRLDRRHLADPGDRHLERPRDRRRGHAQHVDVRPQVLEVLLVLDAEALLLVHDDEAEVLPSRAALDQAVRADHDVDRARR